MSDTLNRVTEIKDLRYKLNYEYDAVGNRRLASYAFDGQTPNANYGKTLNLC